MTTPIAPSSHPTPRPTGGARSEGGISVQWVQVDTLAGGDFLEIHTESSSYLIVVCGERRGLLLSSNPQVTSGEVLLHGAWGEDGVPHWGTIRKGAGLLFSGVKESGEATKTSPVSELFLRKYIKAGGEGIPKPSPIAPRTTPVSEVPVGQVTRVSPTSTVLKPTGRPAIVPSPLIPKPLPPIGLKLGGVGQRP